MKKWALAAALLLLARASDAGQQEPESTWREVDRLRPDTPLVVNLRDGDVITVYFRAATSDEISVATRRSTDRRPVDVIVLPKTSVRTVATRDPLSDGVFRGAALGAAATLPLVIVSVSGCRTGCVRGSALAIAGGAAIVGAGIGTVAGLAADLDAGGSRVVFPASQARGGGRANGFFPPHPVIRVRPLYGRTGFYGSTLSGSAAVRGLGVAVQISRHMSVHAEYVNIDHAFYPPTGAVSNDVLRNIIDASVRIAGWSRGIERRYASYELSEMIAIHPPPWGRVRVAFVAGAAVLTQTSRDFYDAHVPVPPGSGRTRALPGKYYVLDFESPEAGLVAGLDAELAISKRLAVVPMLRHHRWDNPGSQLSFTIGGQWRF